MKTYEFEVSKEKIYLSNNIEIPNKVAITRKDNNRVLGIASSDYQIVHHSRIIDTFNQIAGIRLEKANACQEGAILLAKYSKD